MLQLLSNFLIVYLCNPSLMISIYQLVKHYNSLGATCIRDIAIGGNAKRLVQVIPRKLDLPWSCVSEHVKILSVCIILWAELALMVGRKAVIHKASQCYFACPTGKKYLGLGKSMRSCHVCDEFWVCDPVLYLKTFTDSNGADFWMSYIKCVYNVCVDNEVTT